MRYILFSLSENREWDEMEIIVMATLVTHGLNDSRLIMTLFHFLLYLTSLQTTLVKCQREPKLRNILGHVDEKLLESISFTEG